MSKLVIVDYGMGNLRSVKKSLDRIGANVEISDDLNVIESATKIILPGVGNFSKGIDNLKSNGTDSMLSYKVLTEKTPILGICLGMQLMAKYSEEGNKPGLSWIDAEIVKFNIKNILKHKVPHIGWNSLTKKKDSVLLNHIDNESLFYFIHSYHMQCNDEQDIISTTLYDYSFVSSIQRENIYGTQFHPEKSHDWGSVILKNFIGL